MTPPLPPPGYELVEDEPRCDDMAWAWGRWRGIDEEMDVIGDDAYIWLPARDLRWIARKK